MVANALHLALLLAASAGLCEGVFQDDGAVLLQTRVEAADQQGTFVKRRRLEENLSPSAMLARATALAGPPPGTNLDEPYRQVMVNFGDAQYIAYFTIGSQLVGGIVDTGSYELVIFSSVCGSCGAAAEYNPWLSSSYSLGILKTTHSYGSGDTDSEEAFDEVSIGPFADTNQYFWEVTKATMPILYSAAFQAIIGIGPPETPASDAWDATTRATGDITQSLSVGRRPHTDLLQKVSDHLEVAMEMSAKTPLLQTFNVSMFSICIGKRSGSDGYFVWNDYSAFKYQAVFKQVPVVGRHSWSVWLNNVRIQDMNRSSNSSSFMNLGCQSGCSAVIDSGTSLLAVPGFVKNQLEEMMTRMNNDCSNVQDFPDLVFDMNGHTFSLPPDAYIAEVVGAVPNYLSSYVKINSTRQSPPYQPRTRCQLLLMESYATTAYGPLWILGVPFFRKYYTTFHIGKSKKERSLYIAPASKDCRPATNQAALYSRPGRRSVPWLRSSGGMDNDISKVDASRINLPPIAQYAATNKFLTL